MRKKNYQSHCLLHISAPLLANQLFFISVENIEHVVHCLTSRYRERPLYLHVYLLIHLDSFDDVEQRKLPRGIVHVHSTLKMVIL